jgi:hypothetical protein
MRTEVRRVYEIRMILSFDLPVIDVVSCGRSDPYGQGLRGLDFDLTRFETSRQDGYYFE